jgi:hypothetical protein
MGGSNYKGHCARIRVGNYDMYYSLDVVVEGTFLREAFASISSSGVLVGQFFIDKINVSLICNDIVVYSQHHTPAYRYSLFTFLINQYLVNIVAL